MVNVFATAFFENRPIHRDPLVANAIATAFSESRPMCRLTPAPQVHTQTYRVVLVIALGAVVSIAVHIHDG